MEDKVLLVTYSEIGLKTPPVRKHLETFLMQHIRNKLELVGFGDIKLRRIQGRLLFELEESIDHLQAAETIAQVFGVASTRIAIRTTADLKNITDTVVNVAQNILQLNDSFAVDVRRVGNHPYSSHEVEVVTGNKILTTLSSKGIHVNLSNPDKTIHVEVRGRRAYIYHQIVPGYSGLPFGSQGKVLSLFSGGIDSPVATWLMMRRGCFPQLLFYDQRPFVEKDYCEKALEVAKILRKFVPLNRYFFYTISMGEIMKELVDKVPSKLICVCCKRMMYRLGCMLAEKFGCEGLMTGENLGQVASQTLSNLRILDEVAAYPVFRPLLGYEKLEIIQYAQKIGSYDRSITPSHGCTVVPRKPTAKAKFLEVKMAEEKLNISKLTSRALEDVSKTML